MKKAWRIWLPSAAALLVTILFGTGVLRRADRWMQDHLFQHSGVPSSDIIIIGIDEEAFDLLGPYNTWDRNVIASALEALAADPENKPAVTAIDVLYAGETGSEADSRLANAAGQLGNVVTATVAEFGENITWENGRPVLGDPAGIVNYEQPYESLRDNTVQGHINAMSDSDGVLRHALLFIEPEGGRVFSMAYETARLFLEQKDKKIKEPPVSSGGHFYVPYTAGPESYYDGVSVARLIKGEVPAAYWAGKIVLIGPYAPALQDAYFTSIDRGRQMYGVEFQANVIQSLLDGNFKREIPNLPQLVALFVICAAAMAFFLRMKVLPGGGACAGLILLSFAGTMLLYRAGLVLHPLWIPVGIIILYIGSLAVHYALAAKERRILTLEKERMAAELALASRIQTSALPELSEFPDREEFEICASMSPAKEVGGDLYDFFMIDDDHLGLVIGDVSGKGIPASLFMMVSSALLRNAAMHESSPARILQLVNDQVCVRNPEEMFVTVWLGILEISTGKLTAANAGHEYPVIKQPGEHFTLLKDKHGFVIGGMPGTRYSEYELQLEPGAKFFVYTDGVTEATNAAEELFGTERMMEALRKAEERPMEDIVHAVKEATLTFTGELPQFDDLTMLCLVYRGSGSGEARV